MSAVAIVQNTNVESYRSSTDAAGLCKDIVVASALTIQGRKYVRVEGWQAIAVAHGCTGSAREVERVEGGVRAVGEIRRMSDGVVIAEAEGFVGEDEPTWYGGKVGNKTLPKRPDYAIRAMAQTRAISRAARSAFAHVVVMMNAGLSTTPAEEVPDGGFDERPSLRVVQPEEVEQPPPAQRRQARQGESLKDRADRLQRALETADAMPVLRKTYELAAKLCAELDDKDPERLVEINALYERRADELENPPASGNDLGIADDEIPY